MLDMCISKTITLHFFYKMCMLRIHLYLLTNIQSCLLTGSGLFPLDRERVIKRIMPNYVSQPSGQPDPLPVTHTPQHGPNGLQIDHDDQLPGSSGADINSQPGPSGLQSVSSESQATPGMNADADTEYSPRKLLIKEITKVLSPEATEDIEKAKRNQSQPRKRIQAKRGEILTEADCIERLRQEEATRNTKSAKNKGVKGKPGLAKTSKPKCKSAPKDVEPQSLEVNSAATTAPAAPAPNQITSDSDSEPENIRPRKPRRKLIPFESNAQSDTELITPERTRRKISSENLSDTPMGDGIILTAWRKLIFLETSDVTQDFDHERLS
jgi:hypothetical protein